MIDTEIDWADNLYTIGYKIHIGMMNDGLISYKELGIVFLVVTAVNLSCWGLFWTFVNMPELFWGFIIGIGIFGGAAMITLYCVDKNEYYDGR